MQNTWVDIDGNVWANEPNSTSSKIIGNYEKKEIKSELGFSIGREIDYEKYHPHSHELQNTFA